MTATPATTPDPGSGSGSGSPPAAASTPAARRVVRFQAGAALAAAFGAYAKLFFPLTVLAAFGAAPGLCLTATYPLEAAKDLEDLAGRVGRMALWTMAIGWLPGLVVVGAVSGIVVRRLRGEPCSVAREVSRAAKMLWRLVGLDALFLSILAPFMALIIGAALMATLVGPTLSLTVSFLFGSLAVAVFMGLQVSTQALVIEDLSPIGAMSRSQTLTKGRRFAVSSALSTVFLTLFVAVCGVLFWLSNAAIPLRIPDAIDATRRHSYLITACHAPISMLCCVLYAVIYHDLRCEKDALAAAGQAG